MYNDPVTGNCFTFNHEDVKSYKISRAGQGQGLLMHLFVNQNEYAPWTDVAGFRLYIHNQVLAHPSSLKLVFFSRSLSTQRV